MDILARLGVDDSPDAVIHADSAAPQDTLDLHVRHGHAEHLTRLLADLIQAADHAQLQASAGSGVGDAVVQPHQVHCPAANVCHDDGGLVQQLRLGQHGGVALGEQHHIREVNGVVPALIAEAHGLTAPKQVVPELLLVPSEAGQGQAGSQQNLRCPLHAPIVQLFGDGR